MPIYVCVYTSEKNITPRWHANVINYNLIGIHHMWKYEPHI
jgi:hypothetical protein